MRAPTRIDTYQVIRRIGVGAAGITYLALSEASAGQPQVVCCIKIPHPARGGDPHYLRTFHDEAHYANLLDHPHIIRLRGVGTHQGRPYLAYCFIEGLNLAELIDAMKRRGQQLAWPVVATLALHVAMALEHAHTDLRGSGNRNERPPILHRDICPANILISVGGSGFLLDFGIARALESNARTPSLRAAGRFQYMAPERLFGTAYGPGADLFSLGASLFEALTGRAPFAASTPASYAEQIHVGRPRVEPLRGEFHTGSPVPTGLVQLAAITHRLLEPDPDQRYRSAAALVDALRAITLPRGSHRELALVAVDCMPPWRRKVQRDATDRPPAVAVPEGAWHATHPDPMAHARAADGYERDAVRVDPDGAARLIAAWIPKPSDATRPLLDPSDFDTTDRDDRPVFDFDSTDDSRPVFRASDFDTTDRDRHPVFETSDASPEASVATRPVAHVPVRDLNPAIPATHPTRPVVHVPVREFNVTPATHATLPVVHVAAHATHDGARPALEPSPAGSPRPQTPPAEAPRRAARSVGASLGRRLALVAIVALFASSILLLSGVDSLWVPLLTGESEWGTVLDPFWTPTLNRIGQAGAVLSTLGALGWAALWIRDAR